MDTVAELQACEEKLLNNSVRKNAEIVSSMLTEDFVEFGSSGRIYTKAEILAFLKTESSSELSLHNFNAELLGSEVALVTYRTVKRENEGPGSAALRSSIWVHRDGQWKLRFHQGTRTEAANR